MNRKRVLNYFMFGLMVVVLTIVLLFARVGYSGNVIIDSDVQPASGGTRIMNPPSEDVPVDEPVTQSKPIVPSVPSGEERIN